METPAHPSLWLVFPPAGRVTRHSLVDLSFHPSDSFFSFSSSSHATTAASPPCIFSRTRLLLCGLDVPPPFSRNLTPGDELFINQASGVMSRCDHSPNHALTSFWRGKNSPTDTFLSSYRPLSLTFSFCHPRNRCIKVCVPSTPLICVYTHSRNMQTQRWTRFINPCVCIILCYTSQSSWHYACVLYT